MPKWEITCRNQIIIIIFFFNKFFDIPRFVFISNLRKHEYNLLSLINCDHVTIRIYESAMSFLVSTWFVSGQLVSLSLIIGNTFLLVSQCEHFNYLLPHQNRDIMDQWIWIRIETSYYWSFQIPISLDSLAMVT